MIIIKEIIGSIKILLKIINKYQIIKIIFFKKIKLCNLNIFLARFFFIYY